MAEMTLAKQFARLMTPGQGFVLVTFSFDQMNEIPQIYTNADWDSTYHLLERMLEARFEVEKTEEEQAGGTNGD